MQAARPRVRLRAIFVKAQNVYLFWRKTCLVINESTSSSLQWQRYAPNCVKCFPCGTPAALQLKTIMELQSIWAWFGFAIKAFLFFSFFLNDERGSVLCFNLEFMRLSSKVHNLLTKANKVEYTRVDERNVLLCSVWMKTISKLCVCCVGSRCQANAYTVKSSARLSLMTDWLATSLRDQLL